MRLGVITAPAGYGKTSHAAAWVARDDRPTAWIDVYEAHNDARVLLTDLMAALTAVTDFRSDDLGLGGATVDEYATSVATALGRAVRACTVPFVLVLDDVQRLHGVAAIDLAGSVVSSVPAGSVVLLVGRTCLVGDLGRLRAGGQLVEFSSSDLALEPRDVALVLSGMGVDASEADTERVSVETEGWPVGVRLAGLAALTDRSRNDGSPALLSSRRASVSDYLESEWLWALTEDERAFLMRVSPLDWLAGPLCNQALGRNDAGELLHRVFRNRLLLVPLDRRGTAYRMHGLLREVLEAEFERVDPAEVRKVHERASVWFETAGDADRAVRHAVAAGNFVRAERLVVEHTPSLYTNGNYATVHRWIESLPREQVVASVALCLCAALAELGLGHPEALSVWIRLGGRAVESSAEVDQAARLCLLDLRSTTNTGSARSALDDAAAAYQGLPPGIWHAAACLALGAWSWAVGEEDAAEILTEGAGEAAVLGAPALEAYCTAMLAMIAHTESDPARAWALVTRARRVAADNGVERAPGMALVSAMHALAAASSGDPDEAKRDWQLARTQLAVLKDLSGWANVQTRVALGHASLLLGDRTGAETVIREAREFLVRQPDAVRAEAQIAELEDLTRQLQRHATSGSSSLTTAELRVLRYLPTNLTLSEIGTRLYVSRYTIKTHCESIYRKLEVGSRSEAVEAARGIGLLDAGGPLYAS